MYQASKYAQFQWPNKRSYRLLPYYIVQADSVSLITNAWIRDCAACVCSGVPDIIIAVSVAAGLGSVIVIFASEIYNSDFIIYKFFGKAIV